MIGEGKKKKSRNLRVIRAQVMQDKCRMTHLILDTLQSVYEIIDHFAVYKLSEVEQ